MRRETALAILLATAAPAAAIAQQDNMAQQDTMGQQDTEQDTMGQQDTMSPASGSGIITSQKSGEILSDSYLGTDVVARAPEGFESVGKVSGLLFGPDDKIVGVVVDVGGFLGVAAKPVGLSWASLSEQQSEEGMMLRTSLSRQDFEEAPEFKTLEAQQKEAASEESMGSGTTGTGVPAATPDPQ